MPGLIGLFAGVCFFCAYFERRDVPRCLGFALVGALLLIVMFVKISGF
jgi:hypothetical protein